MKLSSIQCLRALAALLVVYAHSIDIQMGYSVSHQQNFFYLQNFGAIGVDIFFVISGFIITYVANKYSGPQNAFQFLIKRFFRINPIYYIASGIYLTIYLIYLNPLLYKVYGRLIIASAFDTILVLPATNGYTPLLMIGWTLSFEWLFYIIFSVLISFRSSNKPLHLIWVMSVLVLVGQAYHFSDYRLTFLTNGIILEFMLGIILFLLYQHVKISPKLCYVILGLGVAGYACNILFGYGAISELDGTLNGTLSLKRFFQWGLPSWALVTSAIFLEKNGRLNWLWNNKLFKLTGDASYSIYLTHFPVFLLLMRLVYDKTGFFLPGDLAIFFHLFVATLMGIVFYLFVEKPLLKYLMKEKNERKEVQTKNTSVIISQTSLPRAQ